MSSRRFQEAVTVRKVTFVVRGVYTKGMRGRWRDGVQIEQDDAPEIEIETIGVSGNPTDLMECLDEHVKTDIELKLLDRFDEY